MYTFREIWGNARMVEHLKTAAASGKVSHAYLFVGGAGAGKGMMANTFARALKVTQYSSKQPVLQLLHTVNCCLVWHASFKKFFLT